MTPNWKGTCNMLSKCNLYIIARSKNELLLLENNVTLEEHYLLKSQCNCDSELSLFKHCKHLRCFPNTQSAILLAMPMTSNGQTRKYSPLTGRNTTSVVCKPPVSILLMLKIFVFKLIQRERSRVPLSEIKRVCLNKLFQIY